jgi:hypothetical protein
MPEPRKAASKATDTQVGEACRDVNDEVMQVIAPGGLKSDTEAGPVHDQFEGAPRPAIPFRPVSRPPIAMLTLCDDGKSDGAVFRILTHRFVIGRTEGDLRIEIDGRISARHVEISLQTIGGRHHRWVLTDLQSSHGLFVRVSRARLADGSEFLVGDGRYRFDAPRYDEGETTEPMATMSDLGQTDTWLSGKQAARPPALTELVGNEIGNRVVLLKPEYWIGSDPACPICRPDDLFCEPRHVRVYRNPKGGWHAENNKTLNGFWLRMSQVAVESAVNFQIGEQRFWLRVP